MLTQPIAAFALGAAVLKHGLSKMSAAKMKKTCMRLGMWVGKKPTVAHLRQLLQPVHLAASMSREAGVRSAHPGLHAPACSCACAAGIRASARLWAACLELAQLGGSSRLKLLAADTVTRLGTGAHALQQAQAHLRGAAFFTKHFHFTSFWGGEGPMRLLSAVCGVHLVSLHLRRGAAHAVQYNAGRSSMVALETVDPRRVPAVVYNGSDHYNALCPAPGAGKCCGHAMPCAGAAGALRGLCTRTLCKLHASTGDGECTAPHPCSCHSHSRHPRAAPLFAGYCWFESLAVAFATAGINLRAFVAALEHTVRERAAAASSTQGSQDHDSD